MFDWITGFIQSAGYLGVALLMFAENVFPPIPSELIMPLGGFAAARGDMNLGLVICAGLVGSLLGAVLWYYIGKLVGCDRLKRWSSRHGRWLTLSPDDIDRTSAWFLRHGGKAVFVGRMVPTIRTLISIPAGIAVMAMPRFMLYSTIGTAVWTTALAVAGYLLEDQYEEISRYLNPVSTAVFAVLVFAYVYRVVTFDR
jgi:membrane protein DedA with SNARE-associated domain